MKRARGAVHVVIGLTSICITAPAAANGRFPEAQQIESVPGDPSTLFLRATFGILVSRDGGARWRWICERALGYEGQWDPPIAVTRDGRLWVGLEDGLVSTRDGCDVDAHPELDGHTIKDLTVDARGETLWAISGAPGKTGHVWRRPPPVDGGRTSFDRLAAFEDTNLMTIEVAPSKPSRVYLSGQPYSTIRGQIFRSSDGGATFTIETNRLEADGPFFIGAVDPRDPNRLLVRHLHAKGSDLLLSKDGGRTFRNVLSMASAMFGFAKTADTYWAASGLPDHGIFRSTDRGERFEGVAKHGVLCLHAAAPDALFACENAAQLGAPVVAVSRDRGATMTAIARFTEIEGPVTCASPAARGSLCAGSWDEMRAFLSPSKPDAGAPAEASDAGAAPPAKPRGSKCGCEALGASTPRAAPGALAAVTLLLTGIRRGSRRTHR